MMKLQLCILSVFCLIQGQALQSPLTNRRSFVAAAVSAAVPAAALAAPPEKKAKREAFRGGRQAADDTHNGTDLNDKEASVAGGLMDKMGLPDVDPYKDGKKK